MWAIICSASFAQDQGRALREAARKGDLKEVIRLLNDGADINAQDQYGDTALMVASWKGHVEVVKALLDKGAEVNARDKFEYTALIDASNNDYLEVMQDYNDVMKYFLALARHSDATVKYKRDWAALMKASESPRLQIVNALLARGANMMRKTSLALQH